MHLSRHRKKIEFFVKKRNTKITYPVYVAKKGVAIYYFEFSLCIEHYLDTDGILLRYKRVIPDKSIVSPRFGKDTLWSQVDCF